MDKELIKERMYVILDGKALYTLAIFHSVVSAQDFITRWTALRIPPKGKGKSFRVASLAIHKKRLFAQYIARR